MEEKKSRAGAAADREIETGQQKNRSGSRSKRLSRLSNRFEKNTLPSPLALLESLARLEFLEVVGRIQERHAESGKERAREMKERETAAIGSLFEF